MSIDRFKDNSTTIDIPDFSGMDIIQIKVKRPQLMSMMSQGKIPNRLLGIASQAVIADKGFQYKSKDEEEKAKELAEWVEFYCEICMVEPRYEEVKETITDDQALAIYAWAVAPIDILRSFRNKEENHTDNRNGEALPEKAK